MALEVAQEGVVVRAQVSDRVVFLRRGVDDAGAVVRETCEMGAVFLREEGFDLAAFFGVVEEEGVVGAGGQTKFAGIVKV